MTLTPASVFLATQKELASEHQAAVRSNALAIRLSFALAAMAGKSTVTSENLIGARIFIDTFLNLAEKPDAAKSMAPNKEIRTDAERVIDIREKQRKRDEKQ